MNILDFLKEVFQFYLFLFNKSCLINGKSKVRQPAKHFVN